MRADVDKCADATVFSPCHDQGDVGSLGRAKIKNLRYFALVTNKMPYLVENVLALVREDLLIGQGIAVEEGVEELWRKL